MLTKMYKMSSYNIMRNSRFFLLRYEIYKNYYMKKKVYYQTQNTYFYLFKKYVSTKLTF